MRYNIAIVTNNEIKLEIILVTKIVELFSKNIDESIKHL